jgi:DNA-binding winged helix-turn-helix (wHTH) protein/Tol biopolymer transport system component
MNGSRKYSFGSFRLDADDHTLQRSDGVILPMTPKVADLLIVLAESAGKVVSKEELLDRLWAGTSVEEGNLSFQVHELRQVLGDHATAPRYVETVPRRGYRFIAPVTMSVDTPPDVPRPVQVEPATSVRSVDATDIQAPIVVPARRAGRPWLALAATGLVALCLALVVARREPALPRVSRVVQLTHDGGRKESLVPISGTRLIVSTPREQRVLGIGGEAPEHLDALDRFHVLDVAPSRAEALATRRDDPGGELGLWIVPLDSGSARRLSMIRVKDSAAWSHDGRRIAYTLGESLFVADRDGTAVRELMTFSDQPAEVQWSPDDQTIRFNRHTRSDRVASMTLWDINADGTGGLREVLAAADVMNPSRGRWMASGREFVFEAGPDWHRQIHVLRDARSWFLGRRTTMVVRLTIPPLNWESPVPSSDGKRIFALGMSPPQLVRYDADTRRFMPYLGGIAAYAVQFSPDGQSVSYVSFPDRRLWRARADGTDARALTPESWEAGMPAWSPDGKQIAFRGQVPGQHSKIYLMASDGGTPVPFEPRDIEQGAPTWSPDGTRLAFGDVPETFGQATGTEAIHIYDLARRRQSDLPGSRGLWTSRWSPDGRYLAALTIEGQSLMLFDFKTAAWRSLGVNHVSDPMWSRDGRHIYCFPEQEERRIARVRIPDGTIDSVLDLHREKIQLYGAGLTRDDSPLVLRTPVDVYALELER